MNRPISLLHPIRSKEIGHPSEFVKQVVFEPKKRSRSNDRGLRKYTSHNFFTSGLEDKIRNGLHESDYSPCTFVRKNSEGEFLSALKEET